MVLGWLFRNKKNEFAPPTEIIPIFTVEEPKAEVIFIHGLDGDPIHTWDIFGADSWCRWIAIDCPYVNIWTLRYRMHSTEWMGGALSIQDRALNLLATINASINSTNEPIILICHSYGGLIVKQLLRTSRHSSDKYKLLANRIKGIIFFATPHQGSSIHNYIIALSFIIGRSAKLARISPAVKELEDNSSTLRELNNWFRQEISNKQFKCLNYFESIDTYGIRVVDESASDLGVAEVDSVAVDANHIDICKPKNRNFTVEETIELIRDISTPPSLETSKEKTNNLGTNVIYPIRNYLSASNDELDLIEMQMKVIVASEPENLEASHALMLVRRAKLMIKEEITHNITMENISLNRSKSSVNFLIYPILLILTIIYSIYKYFMQ